MSSDSESDSEPEVVVEPLALGRDKRSNAGARMARLLDNEEEDEFYSTTYGGFAEEANDNDYASENSESDAVDSDFSIDENDEVKSDAEDDDKPKRKRTGVNTKAYKEPKKAKVEAVTKPKPAKKEKKTERPSVRIYNTTIDRKSLRGTTKAKSAAAERREREREVKVKMMKEIAAKKNVPEVRRLTQEELLEEAKKTEQLNIESLKAFQRMELERKKSRVVKQVHKGPLIRYQSVTMPLIDVLPPDTEISVDEDTESGDGEHARRHLVKTTEKCSRSFITFTDEKIFRQYFPQRKVKPPVKQYCPITRLPAKYFDPITQTPYANAQAFRVIREAYQQQILQQNEGISSRKSSEVNRQKQRMTAVAELTVSS